MTPDPNRGHYSLENFYTMSEIRTSRSSAPRMDSTGRTPAERENQRQDWGYTDQYRRMMQRDRRRKTEVEKEQ